MQNNIGCRSAGSISDPDNSADENNFVFSKDLSDKPTGSRIVDVRILVVASAQFIIWHRSTVFLLSDSNVSPSNSSTFQEN
jgi:hypothetical protein